MVSHFLPTLIQAPLKTNRNCSHQFPALTIIICLWIFYSCSYTTDIIQSGNYTISIFVYYLSLFYPIVGRHHWIWLTRVFKLLFYHWNIHLHRNILEGYHWEGYLGLWVHRKNTAINKALGSPAQTQKCLQRLQRICSTTVSQITLHIAIQHVWTTDVPAERRQQQLYVTLGTKQQYEACRLYRAGIFSGLHLI